MFVGSTGRNSGGLRVGGLATGLDTESLVRDMMRIHQVRVDRLKQDRQQVEWRRDAYREVTGILRRFGDDFLSALNPTSNMRSKSNLAALTAVSSDPSYVSVSAASSAVSGTITIAGVDRIATPTSLLGTADLLQPDMTIDSSLETLGADPGTSVEFNVAGRVFTFNSTDSMRHVMNTVNNDTSAGVRFFYSGIESRFIIQTRNTGAATSSLTVSGDFLANLGIDETFTAYNVSGQDASVRFQTTGGLGTVPLNQASNTFTVDGITYNLHRATPAGVSLNVTVSQNTDRTVNAIKAFVERYNQVLTGLNEKLGEQRFRDYRPLTEDQRNEMSDQQIEQWEKRAKSGLLQNNRILESAVNALRSAFTQPFQAAGISLQDIGITTGSHFERGRLHLDETRLREAVGVRHEQIASLFSSQSTIAYSPDLTSAQRAQRTAESGIAHRVSDVLQDFVRLTRNNNGRKGTLLERAGFTGSITEFQNEMNTQMRGIDNRIDTSLDAMERNEQRYWRQFTALEDAIQRMNAQSAWLAQQLGTANQ